MVVACAALLVALGGTGYAATQLPRNSVTTIQVKDRTLLAKDFKAGQLPAGPAGATGAQGPAGPQGAQGPAGPAGTANLKWAVFSKDGGIVNQNTDMRLVSRPFAGSYIVNVGSPARGRVLLATPAFAGGDTGARGSISVSPCGGPPEGIDCPTGNDSNHVWLFTYNTANTTPEDHSFYLAVLG